MAKLDPPQLRIGPLSGAVYVVTHGKYSEDGRFLDASRKYDVTGQFEALARERGWTPPTPSRGDGEEEKRAPHPEGVGRRWQGARGPLVALIAALRRRKPLCFTGNVLVAFAEDVPDSDLWRARAEMVLDADDLAALEQCAAAPLSDEVEGEEERTDA